MAGNQGGPPSPIAGLALDEVAELEALGSRPAYDAFLAAARALDVGVVEECRANIALAFHNVKRGVEAVLSREAEVAALPGVKPEELRELPLLVQGLAFAALEAKRDLRADAFGPLFERANLVRRRLLKTAEALAEAGLLAEVEVDAGRSAGRRDVIGDCGALAALFRRNETKLAGRSPVTADDVGEAERVAEQLRVLLAPPADARDRESSPLVIEAIATRDRFWTLLNQRYEVLWRCGAWLYGREVDDRVPPLQVRHALVRRGEGLAERGAGSPAQRRHESRPTGGAGQEPPRSADAMERSKVRFLVRVGFDFPSR